MSNFEACPRSPYKYFCFGLSYHSLFIASYNRKQKTFYFFVVETIVCKWITFPSIYKVTYFLAFESLLNFSNVKQSGFNQLPTILQVLFGWLRFLLSNSSESLSSNFFWGAWAVVISKIKIILFKSLKLFFLIEHDYCKFS